MAISRIRPALTKTGQDQPTQQQQRGQIVFGVQGGVIKKCCVFGTTSEDGYKGKYQPHAGVDVFAPAGTPVMARAPAKVYKSGNSKEAGGYVFLEYNAVGLSGDKVYVGYYHLDPSSVLAVGEGVDTRDVIGRIGTDQENGSGAGSDTHVHVQVFRSREAADKWSTSDVLDPFGVYVDSGPVLRRGGRPQPLALSWDATPTGPPPDNIWSPQGNPLEQAFAGWEQKLARSLLSASVSIIMWAPIVMGKLTIWAATTWGLNFPSYFTYTYVQNLLEALRKREARDNEDKASIFWFLIAASGAYVIAFKRDPETGLPIIQDTWRRLGRLYEGGARARPVSRRSFMPRYAYLFVRAATRRQYQRAATSSNYNQQQIHLLNQIVQLLRQQQQQQQQNWQQASGRKQYRRYQYAQNWQGWYDPQTGRHWYSYTVGQQVIII